MASRHIYLNIRADNNLTINYSLFGSYTRSEKHINSFGFTTKNEVKSYITNIKTETLNLVYKINRQFITFFN